jgi:hypothetical protein
MYETNQEISIKLQEKFEFYFLSLTFVLLGLSIQTAKLGGNLISDSLEIVGWILLLISGFAGLSRTEWLPQIYKVIHEKQDRENYRDEAKRRKSEGDHRNVIIRDQGEKPIKEFIMEVEDGIEILHNQVEKLERKSMGKYKIHKYAFVFGLIFIIASRAYIPLSNIIKHLLTI